jgi:hypothetical protein
MGEALEAYDEFRTPSSKRVRRRSEGMSSGQSGCEGGRYGNLKDVKNKIKAVKKTKQITKAMNMVAASSCAPGPT